MSALNFLSVILSHCRKFGVESKAYDLTPRYACQHRLETDHFSMILTLSALTLCLYSILPGNGYIGFIFMQTCSVKSERREIQDDTSPADLETINVFRYGDVAWDALIPK